MLKALTAYTQEIDEVEVAVSELLDQLDLEQHQKAHSIGLVSCYTEFVDSGVVAALAARLDFPLVGITTLGSSARGQTDMLLLTLTVLTGDDVAFSAACTGSLQGAAQGPVHAAYQQARQGLGEDPALILAFGPLLQQHAGDTYIEALDAASGGVPVFGTLAVDHTPDYHQAGVLMNGTYSPDALVLVLVSGNISPRFCAATLPEESISREAAVITKSEGNLLISVNDMPVIQFLETLGLAQNGQVLAGISALPFFLTLPHSPQRVLRSIFAITEEGNAVCGGLMPEGAGLSVGVMNREDLLASTRKTVQEALSQPGSLLLSFACTGRAMALGVDPYAELRAVADIALPQLAYQMTISGGEFCPVPGENGAWVNRFHNATMIACVL